MFSKSATREKVVAVADIESASAGIALVKIVPGKPAEILMYERRTLSYEDREPRAAVSAMLGLLTEAGEKVNAMFLTSAAHPKVSECVVVLHAPLAHSVSLHASSQSAEDILVTQEMIADLAKQAFANDTELDKAELFESSITRIKLNGYQCDAPTGKSAHRIEVTVLASACNQSLRSSIESTLDKLFPQVPVTIRSSIRASVSVIRATLGRSEECLIVDMVGDATTFTCLDQDMMLDHEIMPAGYRTLLKSLSGDSLPEDKLSVLHMIEKDAASNQSSEKLQIQLARLEPELLKSYGKALATLALQHRLPEDLVLLVQRDFAPWLSTFFSRIDFTQFTVTLRPFSVHLLEAESLTHEIIYTDSKGDAGLSIAASLVNREAMNKM